MTRDFPGGFSTPGGSFSGIPGLAGAFPAGTSGGGMSAEAILGGSREHLEFTSGAGLLRPNFLSLTSISIPLPWDKV